jgi:DNA repair exonuclease SbcCD nuclease subunit
MEYIGSPLQLSFGEAGEEKHVIILDTKTNSKKYISNDFSPKHHYINQSDLHKFTKEELERSFVTLIADVDNTSLDKKDLENKVQELGIDTIKIRQKPKDVSEHILEDAKAILSDEDKLIERYVEQVSPEGLDRNILVNLGQSITQYEGSSHEKD